MATNQAEANPEWDGERAEEEADRRRKAEPPPIMDGAEFLAWRSPRPGISNPTRQENPLWKWLVRTRWDAFNANNLFSGPSPYDAGPMWTFHRFGSSETKLLDGRVIHIGGEHEDHYDPDFHIYNDVTVIDTTGEIFIYGYPQEDFPPTDFHSATRVGDSIFIIGRLGHPESREREMTPVYRLSLDSMRIEVIPTRGHCPGWIYRHAAELSPDGHTILVRGGERWFGKGWATRRNIDSWAFDPLSAEWHRLTSHGWQHWVMRRIDRKPNRLWETRQVRWHREHAHLGLKNSWSHKDAPDLAALDSLYRLAGESDPPVPGADTGSYTARIDGLTVQFREEGFWVEAIVQGHLSNSRLADLQRSTMALLQRIDGAPYELENLLDEGRTD
ncbi:MAG: hypothetical protein IT580_05350 [Verrucomicrobiales bacterium]|nr:hypothetical protein [Verrucomicrobiales bacterium]